MVKTGSSGREEKEIILGNRSREVRILFQTSVCTVRYVLGIWLKRTVFVVTMVLYVTK